MTSPGSRPERIWIRFPWAAPNSTIRAWAKDNPNEVFLTGTAAEVIPVVRIDRRDIGDGTPGPITLRLLEMFRNQAANNTN